jgi:hypothetical protein
MCGRGAGASLSHAWSSKFFLIARRHLTGAGLANLIARPIGPALGTDRKRPEMPVRAAPRPPRAAR